MSAQSIHELTTQLHRLRELQQDSGDHLHDRRNGQIERLEVQLEQAFEAKRQEAARANAVRFGDCEERPRKCIYDEAVKVPKAKRQA